MAVRSSFWGGEFDGAVARMDGCDDLSSDDFSRDAFSRDAVSRDAVACDAFSRDAVAAGRERQSGLRLRIALTAMAQSQSTTDLPRLWSSAQVAGRFVGRLTFFAAFAVLTRHGFDRVMVCALVLMLVYCAIAAFVRRESVSAPALTHWDEAAGYGLIYALLIHFG